MITKKNRTRARWLVATLVVLLLTLLGAQGSFTQDLAQQYALGDIPLDPATYQKYLKVWPEDMATELLSDSYDARDEGIVTPAKNQGSCGSCWAFASVGAMESHLLKAYGFGPTDLSEQQQVSCNTSMSGCCGGNSSASGFWENTGPVYEGCFPYGDGGTSCPTTTSVPCNDSNGCTQLGYRVIDWHTVSSTTTDFKNSLFVYGPSYWRFNVYSDFYTYWGSGSPGAVYVNSGGTFKGGHAVLLIGWDDAKSAYLLQNSWGTNVGPNGDGTFWVAYSGHQKNLGFGMSNFSLTQVGCASDADCDDGLHCNGAETCVDNVCQDGTPPSCPDDGLFCNGSEVCDEVIDGCGHTGNPCTEPGTLCDEVADQCVVVACYSDADCDDGEDCSADTCHNPAEITAYCENLWPACGLTDGCCGPDCSSATDDDCTCGDGVCAGAANGEDCYSCPADCESGQGGTCDACFKGVCNGDCHPVKEGPDCADCASNYCCGNGDCEVGESPCNCTIDCGEPDETETACSDQVDNDCDGFTDCDDSDCGQDPACECWSKGTICTADEQCCSNKCRGGKCR
jgi:hypothetical protein